MLRVANPQKVREREKVATIAGRTNIGARVEINDTTAPVDPEGRFRMQIQLQSGKNQVEVISTTPWGNATRKLPPIVIEEGEPENPSVDSAEVRWGKHKKSKRKKKHKKIEGVK
jgi:hypothetical protein